MAESPAAGPRMSVLFDLWLVGHLISGALDEPLSGSGGLSGDEFGFYSLLRRFGPTTPGQIARWTAMRPTTVSSLLRRLEQRGHIEQRPNPADGRSRLVALTAAGEEAHSSAAGAFFAATRGLAAELGPEEARQRASLQRLDRALRAVTGLDGRPYTVAEDGPSADGHHLSYDGEPLDADEEADVRQYIDVIRTRRERSSSHGTPRTTDRDA